VDISADNAVRRRDVSEYVRDEPLTALAIAAATGFVLGGGINRRVGLAMLTTVGQIALRSVAASLIGSTMTRSHDHRAQGIAGHGNGRHDNSRTDF